MYTSFFGLNEKPFAITPDPRYLYMSERHAEALAHLLYGMNDAGGFIQLTGEVGTGKTTVVRTLLEQIPQHADVAVVLNPRQTPLEFLLTLCQELGVFVRDEDEGSIKDLIDVLNHRLLSAHAKGRRVVVIIDEAQNLPTDTLEQVRLLTNLETPTQKLLQIILIGQPELRELLARSDLRQLAQRITGRYHLTPLSRDDTAAYVRHRLKVAGATEEIFSDRGLREVHRQSGGVPRIINVICDRALLGAYTESHHRIDTKLVRQAADEVFGRVHRPAWLAWAAGMAGVTACFVIAFAAWRFMPLDSEDAIPTAVAQPAPAVPASSAPAPAQVAAAPTLEQIDALLAARGGETGTDQAFKTLLALWGEGYDAAEGTACTQAVAQGLQCVFQKGSWGQLRNLNRPAILSLTDDAGREHQLVVASLADDRAGILLSDGEHLVSIADLSRYWDGDYLIVWKPQVASEKVLAMGMRGAEVDWLRRSLASLQGRELPADATAYFDAELAAQVEDFQRTHRLTVDGIAGVQTQIVLDALVGEPNSPLLRARAGG